MRVPHTKNFIYTKQTEVIPDWQKLDELFEKVGTFPEGYEEHRGKPTMPYEHVLRWTRSAGVHGAKDYIIRVFFELDTGKVMALRRAGWSAQEIADDMDVDVKRIKEFLQKGEINNGREENRL